MLGLILLYFIGKYFFDLAKEYNKNKWLFAFVGIATYYGATFIFGLLIAFYAILSGNDSILQTNDILLSLMALPFGLLAIWGLYSLLKNNWKKSPSSNDIGILDNDQLDF